MSEYTQSGREERLIEFIEKYKRGKYRKEIAGLSQINGKSILIDLSEAEIIDSTKVVPLRGTPKIKIGLKSFLKLLIL